MHSQRARARRLAQLLRSSEPISATLSGIAIGLKLSRGNSYARALTTELLGMRYQLSDQEPEADEISDYDDALWASFDDGDPGPYQIIGGYYDPEIGFISLKRLKRAFTVPKKIRTKLKKLGNDVLKVAKVVGPAVVAFVPGAGPALAAGMVVAQGVVNGDPAAIAKAAAVNAAAASGDPTAQKAAEALQIADVAVKNQLATQTLTAAKEGSTEALAQIARLKSLAESGDELAKKAYSYMQGAAEGLQIKAEINATIKV